ncbi:unnamed protein product [Protopolystoma xenopodis]|uniref:Uncharacterized protein n=1 Tax=Protopolystoma xenopodis TaxID=117903 RepID=A0A3S5APY3_9PLAT|nr:unnamed protein product [Protopolystoma xenopodis]
MPHDAVKCGLRDRTLKPILAVEAELLSPQHPRPRAVSFLRKGPADWAPTPKNAWILSECKAEQRPHDVFLVEIKSFRPCCLSVSFQPNILSLRSVGQRDFDPGY